MKQKFISLFLLMLLSSFSNLFANGQKEALTQPTIGVVADTGVTEITVDGFKFRDASKNGTLDAYEDWRLSPLERAQDLVTKMDIDQKTALLSEAAFLGAPTDDIGTVAIADDIKITDEHIRFNLTRWSYNGDAAAYATYHNALQKIAASAPLGIPMVILTDPVHEAGSTFDSTALAPGGKFHTPNPMHLGLGAIASTDVAREVGAMNAEEFRAAGSRLLLGPMADLASEPMWNRVIHTFGADPSAIGQLAKAYIQGLQGNDNGVNPETGVAATLKHFPGTGPNEGGMDSHSFPGRSNVYGGDNFEMHLDIMRIALEANPAALMPSYSINETTYKGKKIENVPSAYSKIIMQDILRDEIGWDGLVTSDWGTLEGSAYGITADMTIGERIALFTSVGSHQVGNGKAKLWESSLEEGNITEDVIDSAAVKVLELAFKVGAFENPYSDPAKANAIVSANKKRGEELMKEAITLLKNKDSILPLDSATKNLNNTPGIQIYFAGHTGNEIAKYTAIQGFNVVNNISDADYVIKRISAREGMYFGLDGGVPLSWDGKIFVYDQKTNGPGKELSKQGDHKYGGLGSDNNTAQWSAVGADLQKTIDSMNPSAKLILDVFMFRPFIIEPFLKDIDVLLVDYGSTNSSVLDIIFQMENMVPNKSVQPTGKLPMAIPASDADVYAQNEDVPNDSPNKSFELGEGITSY